MSQNQILDRTAEIKGKSPEAFPVDEMHRECVVKLRKEDSATGIQFYDCVSDYIACKNQRCIKKLL